ncbi:unnamed protein product [Adineta steineri]|uniref:Uncharacterized protein n=1 Tax=Adineta steineri TaxID=433720 RepID=A0A820DZ20_9BILA|nr:unnamed protein product [Adineta steineri]
MDVENGNGGALLQCGAKSGTGEFQPDNENVFLCGGADGEDDLSINNEESMAIIVSTGLINNRKKGFFDISIVCLGGCGRLHDC